LTGRAQQLPEPQPRPPIETILQADVLTALRSEHPDALGLPRQQARFLAGITSPATTRAKLTRHRLFGSLAERRFADVLAWCEATGG
jgi:ATP-dependent DNA helicase RecQ